MCTKPDCPENVRDRRWRRPAPHPDCVCGKPLMLYVPPGEHAHPCPVHPEYVIRGAPFALASWEPRPRGFYGGVED